MAALALVSPAVFKRVLEQLGWVVLDEGRLNWVMVKDGIPVTIPKSGRLLARETLEACLNDGTLSPGEYFAALRAIGYEF